MWKSVMLNQEITLFIITTLTSTIAGIAGMGGGIILVLLLPFYLPAQAVIPIHGVAQLASNGSRLLFSLKHVVWRYVVQFIIGAIFGTITVSWLIIKLNLIEQNYQYIPLIIASYLLLSLWVKPLKLLLNRIENFYLIGALQTGLGLLVGAPGPITVTLLYKKLSEKEQVIATASLLMGLTNANKIFIYALIGFHYFDYLSVMVATILGAILGSFIGTKLRYKIPKNHFMSIIKVLITLMAMQILIGQFLSFIK